MKVNGYRCDSCATFSEGRPVKQRTTMRGPRPLMDDMDLVLERDLCGECALVAKESSSGWKDRAKPKAAEGPEPDPAEGQHRWLEHEPSPVKVESEPDGQVWTWTCHEMKYVFPSHEEADVGRDEHMASLDSDPESD